MNTHYIYAMIIYILIFISGAAVGSFLNICIDRLPKEKPLIGQRPYCTSCGAPIKCRDMIPVISRFILKGKCRSCGAKISSRYIVVELLNALCWLFIAWQIDVLIQPVRFMLTALLFSALIVVFFTDWDAQLISTFVVIFIALLSIPNYIFCHEAMGTTLKSHIIGLFVVSLPLFLIELLSKGKAMGRGDVFLMAAGGLFLGVQNILVAFCIGLISGLIAGLIIKFKTKSSVFAFGPWLSIGIAVSALYGDRLAEWYLTVTGLNDIIK